MSLPNNTIPQQIQFPQPQTNGKRFAYLLSGISFLLFFILGIFAANSLLQRKAVISAIKNQYTYIFNILNEAGIDVAYDELKFNTLWPFPLLEAQNVKIYVPGQQNSYEWNVRNITVKTGLLSAAKFDINVSKEQNFKFDGKSYNLNIGDYKISIENNREGLNSFVAEFYNTGISNLAEIGEMVFAARRIAPHQISDSAPFLKTYAEFRNIQLNGLLNYPLSQKIDRIYLDSDVIARLKKEDSWKSLINTWLARGGKISVKALTLNWLPLFLVGKGDILFDEKASPSVRLQTSSKALLDLIKQLEEKKVLDNKGVFVAKILLENKAYKASPNDKHLTVSTPVSYKDGVVSVEKIAIYNAKTSKADASTD